MNSKIQLPSLLEKYEDDILKSWMHELMATVKKRGEPIKEKELKEQCGTFLRAFCLAMQADPTSDVYRKDWQGVREILSTLSANRARQGFSSSETAVFVFSLKQPIYIQLQKEFGSQADGLFSEFWFASQVLDNLGLYTTEVHQKSREEIIGRQQHEMLELSTPVVKLWDGVLGLPLIGTLDSNRSQLVMESLLQAIVDQGADIAIIDITGVPTVDTLTAQHLLKAVAAARLMGADCIISGIRPQIAQTIVHLGIDLHKIKTKATLAEALSLALRQRGLGVKPLTDSPKN